MAGEKQPSGEKRLVIPILLSVIALLLAGVLVALVLLLQRMPRQSDLSDATPRDDEPESPPAEPTSAEIRPATTAQPRRPADAPPIVQPSHKRTPKRATHETGVFSISVSVNVYLDPDDSSRLLRTLPEGATFEALARQGDYRLIRWTDSGESFEGWILVATMQAPSAELGGLTGTVHLSGEAPGMAVPAKRRNTDFCKSKDMVHDAVLARDGKLQDVVVRIIAGGVPGDWRAPSVHATIEQRDCVYVPRIQGVMAGQQVDILNEDGTLHNVHGYRGMDSIFNQAQPRGAPPFTREIPSEPGVLKIGCDVHPWMRTFLVVTDHPFFAVTDESGRFTIQGIPPGRYTIEALHSMYGSRRLRDVVIAKGATAEVDFTFKTSDPAPDWNAAELSGLW